MNISALLDDNDIIRYAESLMPEHLIMLVDDLTVLIPEGRRYALSAYMLGMNEGLRLGHGVINRLTTDMRKQMEGGGESVTKLVSGRREQADKPASF